MRDRRCLWLALGLLFLAGRAVSQAPPAGAGTADAASLAKKLSNPISSLISVPFQSNWEFGLGPAEETRYLLNFQPVIPFKLNEDWNLISRTIVPVLSQPPLVSGGSATFGFSDFLASFFFSPAEGEITWGVGPAFALPATADPFLGTGKWSLGPTGVVLKQSGPWTMGALANHLWSFAGSDARGDVNQTFLQPFLAYNTKNGVSFTVNSESTVNWEAASGQEWTAPISLQITKITRIGHRPASIGGGAGYFAEKPDGGPEWKLRLLVVLLFPT